MSDCLGMLEEGPRAGDSKRVDDCETGGNEWKRVWYEWKRVWYAWKRVGNECDMHGNEWNDWSSENSF